MRYLYYLLILFFVVSIQTQAQNSYAVGLTGSAACFTVSDAPELDVTGDFTVEAWVYISDNNSSSRFIIDRAFNWQFFVISQSVRFDLQGGKQISTGTLTLNQWHHVAVVRKNSRTLIFANGAKTEGADLAISAGDQGCVIGGQDGWYSGAPTSLLDEVRFSNNAIYDTTGFSVSTTSPLGTTSSTIFYFQFENNSEFPPLDDGPLSLATVNGRPAGSYPMTVDNYITPPAGLPLPVELTSFTAANNGNEVILNWQTATEVNNYGFEVQRAVDNSNNFETLDFIEGYGNSNSTKSYSYTDKSLVNGKYFYRLKQIDIDGEFEYSDVVAVEIGTPAKYALLQNYPNPFNPTTTIQFSIPEAANVNLVVFNALGEQVSVLADGLFEAGMHKVNFDASNLSSGIYFYQIKSQDFLQIKKMMLVK